MGRAFLILYPLLFNAIIRVKQPGDGCGNIWLGIPTMSAKASGEITSRAELPPYSICQEPQTKKICRVL